MSRELATRLWASIHAQRWDELPGYFRPDAVICWPNTNEQFTVADFVAANREYPGDWRIEVERVEVAGDTVITVIRTQLEDGISFHAVSFFEIADGQILRLTEYWGDDGPPPQWRTEQQIGRPMRQ